MYGGTTAAEILLVEDDPASVRLAREALKESALHLNLSVQHDGEQALSFLRHVDPHSDAPRPDLILLDMNLPRKDGLAVLKELKGDDTLKSIPVVMFTTSEAPRDVQGSYGLHANCYITKPRDLDQYFRVMRSITEFWLTTATLPPRR